MEPINVKDCEDKESFNEIFLSLLIRSLEGLKEEVKEKRFSSSEYIFYKDYTMINLDYFEKNHQRKSDVSSGGIQ